MVGILESGLDGEGTGVAGLAEAGVVRACISTLGLDVGDVEVGIHKLLVEVGEAEKNG